MFNLDGACLSPDSKNNSILLYAVNIRGWEPEDSEYSQLLELLNSKEEREVLLRKQKREDRILGLVGKLLIYYTLSRLAIPRIEVSDLNLPSTTAWKKLKFKYNQQGRPSLHEDFMAEFPLLRKIDYNLSHHGDFSVLAIGIGLRVGVDVMKVELPPSDPNQDAFYNWFQDELSKKEWDQIEEARSVKDYDRLNRFFEIWCLKESLIKGIGNGLQIPLSSMSFNLGNKPLSASMKNPWSKSECHIQGLSKELENNLKITSRDFDGWKFEEFYLSKDHCVALAHVYQNNKESEEKIYNITEAAPFIEAFRKYLK